MTNIVYQYNNEHCGNDCVIYDTVLILKVFYEYMVLHIRKYSGGWFDKSTNVEKTIPCESLDDAMREYNSIINSL